MGRLLSLLINASKLKMRCCIGRQHTQINRASKTCAYGSNTARTRYSMLPRFLPLMLLVVVWVTQKPAP